MSFGNPYGRGAVAVWHALLDGDRAAALDACAGSDQQIMVEVHSLLVDGFDVDALTRLERWLDPKWPSTAACAAAYREAMASPGRRPSPTPPAPHPSGDQP